MQEEIVLQSHRQPQDLNDLNRISISSWKSHEDTEQSGCSKTACSSRNLCELSPGAENFHHRESVSKMFKSLSRLTFASDDAKERLLDSIVRVKTECIQDAEEYKPVSLRHLRNDAQTMVKTDRPDVSAELTTLLSTNFDIGFQRFLSDIKGGILKKMCNSLGRFVEATMNEMVSGLTNEELAHLMVSGILEESYDIQYLAVKAEADELIQTV